VEYAPGRAAENEGARLRRGFAGRRGFVTALKKAAFANYQRNRFLS
jgi:hypothetical protein